jgi:hypothetical protein
MVTNDNLCWSRGPRIGNDGTPYCKKPGGHEGSHEPAPEDGWGNLSWGKPDLRCPSIGAISIVPSKVVPRGKAYLIGQTTLVVDLRTDDEYWAGELEETKKAIAKRCDIAIDRLDRLADEKREAFETLERLLKRAGNPGNHDIKFDIYLLAVMRNNVTTEELNAIY